MLSIRRWFILLSSTWLALGCLLCLFILVFVGTIDQVNKGIFLVQKQYFQSLFVTYSIAGRNIPIFPGGALVGSLLVVNLLVMVIKKKMYRIKSMGLFLIHIGLITLIIGSGLISVLAEESHMSLDEGVETYYSEKARENELVLIDKTPSEYDTVISISQSILETPQLISSDELPVDIRVLVYLDNAALVLKKSGIPDYGYPTITRGLGTGLQVLPRPVVTNDKEVNLPAAIIEIIYNKESQGIWLLSRALDQADSVTLGEKAYSISLRSKRLYNPYSITLKKFKREYYQGTTIPKAYSSIVQLNDSEFKESRETLIYMNHPLRYRGKTYYQASFGENDTRSILQVVENPGWILPYVSCILISIGLFWQFFSHLYRFSRKLK